jgi:hypothetical protein
MIPLDEAYDTRALDSTNKVIRLLYHPSFCALVNFSVLAASGKFGPAREE